ncbi:permease [Acaryochloris sp. 'Moss Beach']|uniref:permease n=1 Tax=Acaryochloris TaxID=155977 RepID=UPI001BAEFC0D|nr:MULTISPECIES: permease [Acaryochloris]QUY43096.1 permease [Acaryochloris marina S15]UJB67969.1 permease [Acaryochloris sp. 'Moss Beach']
MSQLGSGLTLFLSLMVEAMPFLIFGVLVSGVLLIFIDEKRLVAMFPKNPLLGALSGSLFGFLFPVCECGNVPVARRLLIQGASAPVAIGFLLAAPTINPVVIWATWTAFPDQPEIVILRVVFSFAIATIIGWVFSWQSDLKPFLQPNIAALMPVSSSSAESTEVPGLLKSGTYILNQTGKPIPLEAANLDAVMAIASPQPKSLWDKLPLLLDNTIQELREMGGVLVLGSLFATIIQVSVPRNIILAIGQGPVTSVFAMVILGGIISICSTVDAFFALSFASTFTSGALLAFLVFGPMFDLKSMGLLLMVFKPRAVFYIFAMIFQLTLVFTLIINLWIS